MIKLLYTNLVDKAELTASSEDAFFPVSNIKNHFTTKAYRSESGTPSADVIFDLRTIEDVDYILVKGNALDGRGFNGSLTIEANATANFTSPAFTTSLTFDDQFNIGILKLPSTETFRFWRIVGSGTSFFELSNVFIGVDGLNFTQNNVDYGWTNQNIDNSKFRTNRYGQRFIDEINDIQRYNLSVSNMNVAEKELMEVITDTVGKHQPFWMILDDTETISTKQERHAGQFFLNQRPTYTNTTFKLYDTTLAMREVI